MNSKRRLVPQQPRGTHTFHHLSINLYYDYYYSYALGPYIPCTICTYIPSDPFNARNSLFKKLKTLKIFFFLHNFKSFITTLKYINIFHYFFIVVLFLKTTAIIFSKWNIFWSKYFCIQKCWTSNLWNKYFKFRYSTYRNVFRDRSKYPSKFCPLICSSINLNT